MKECITDFLNSGKVPKTRVDSNHIRERIKCATQSKVVGLIYAKAAIVNAGIQKNDLLIHHDDVTVSMLFFEILSSTRARISQNKTIYLFVIIYHAPFKESFDFLQIASQSNTMP